MQAEKIKLDYYQLLGITPTATQEEIKKAYQERAQRAHPDKEGGSEEAFRELGKAYNALRNKQKRAFYDRGLRQGIDPHEFEVTLHAYAERLTIEALALLETTPGYTSLKDCWPAVISQARSALQAEQEETEARQRTMDRALKGIKRLGSDNILLETLFEKQGVIDARRESLRIRREVLVYIEECFNSIEWAEEQIFQPRLGGIFNFETLS